MQPAGFNGFDQGKDGPVKEQVENVGAIRGEYSAFLKEIDSIVDFLLPDQGGKPVEVHDPGRLWVYNWASPFCIVVWGLIAGVVVWLGFRVTRGARQFSLVVLAVYVLLIVWLLNSI